MSRVTKWKFEKTKVKVVFRLQFHATHIPQNGWDKLYISFIPAESGKVTAKTTKANVRNGTCKWADPVYETTRLLQDSRTKHYEEKFYKLVVSMGTSRSSLLGEATINLADYVDASKPVVVQLPLQGSDSGAFLHVTVQLLTSKTGFREFEQQRELSERGLQGTSDQDGLKQLSSGDTESSHIEKVSSRYKFKPDSKLLPSLEEEAELNEEYADQTTGFGGLSNTYGSLCAENHYISGSQDVDCMKSTVSVDLDGLSLSQTPIPEKRDLYNSCFVAEGTSDWVPYHSSDISAANDLSIGYQEDNKNIERVVESAETSIHELQKDMSTLQTHQTAIGIEMQKLTEQLTCEFSSTNELAKNVSLLKSECFSFREDIQYPTNLKMNVPLSRMERSSGDPRFVEGLLILEDKVRGLLNKAVIGSQDNDLRFLIPDLELVHSFLLDLKRETKTLVFPHDKVSAGDPGLVNIRTLDLPDTHGDCSAGEFGMDVCHPEDLLGMNLSGLSSHGTDPTVAMQGEIFKLLRELDESKAEKESLVKKTEQMECYYEALIQELEETQKQMLVELQSLRNEHSTCIYTISTTKAQMEAMHQEMGNKLLQLAENRMSLESRNNELERRVLASEAALKRARLNYSIAVDQLQKDLEVLSLQVMSMYETNENLIRRAFSNSSEPWSEECMLETLQRENLDAEDNSCAARPVLSNDQKGDSGMMLLKNLKRSLNSQEDLHQKMEEEILDLSLTHVRLDVFAKVLKEKLRETSDDIMVKDQRISELTEQLETLRKSDESLILKLQIAEDDIKTLTKAKDSCLSQIKEMSLLNQTFEERVRRLTEENCIAIQRCAELESTIAECKSYKSRYEACDADKLSLIKLLEDSTVENDKLVTKITECEASMEEYRGYKSQYKVCDADKMVLTSQLEELTLRNGNLENKISELEALLAEYGSYKRRYEACDAEKTVLSCSLEALTAENGNLVKKVTELEDLVADYSSYKSRCEACVTDKTALETLLDESTAKIDNLVNNISFLEEEMAKRKARFDELAASKGNLQKLVNFLQEKLQGLVATHCKQSGDVAVHSWFLGPEMDSEKFVGVISALEEHLNNASEQVLQLMKKIKEVEEERDMAQFSLTTKSSEAEIGRQKFEHELVLSNAAMDKLNAKLHHVCERLDLCSQVEGRCSEMKEDLFTDLARIEAELQELTTKNGDLAQEIFALGDTSEELGRMKLIMTELSHDKQDLTTSLKTKSNEVIMLESELNNLKDKLVSINEELSIQRDSKVQLENELSDITSQLNKKNENLICFQQQEADLIQLRGSISILESEKLHLSQKLIDAEERLKETQLIKEATLKQHLAAGVENHVEMTKLSTDPAFLRSKLESYVSLDKAIKDSNCAMPAELDRCKNCSEVLGGTNSDNKIVQTVKLRQLHCILSNCLCEIDDLVVCNQEQEIMSLVFQAKLIEQFPLVDLLKECGNNQILLKKQCDELNVKLSEQSLKTEEFRNLSIHLEVLKNKAEAELLQAREKEDERSSFAASQESLRIVFIREQYETKIQELKDQLSISKKHGEEMLWKLQNALNDAENRRKSEESHLQKNEELSLKIMELEDQLQSVLSDNRDKVKAYDQIKAEWDCSLMSLECCKEERQKVLDSLEECTAEKCRIAGELDLLRSTIENSAASQILPVTNVSHSVDQVVRDHQGNANYTIHSYVREVGDAESVSAAAGLVDAAASCATGNGNPDTSTDKHGIENNMQLSLGRTKPQDLQGICGEMPEPKEDGKITDVINNQIEEQNLKSSMDLVQKVLEKMKIENSALLEDHEFEPHVGGLHGELMQLQKVNEELQQMSPAFNDIYSCGTSIERVLALVKELADVLQAKKHSSIQFQSSFLKQHNDEAAVFRSFKDINDLIKDMLELKGKHNAVEMELKEMHERYSELSIRFAEVEGEKQKLMMTLKNVRPPKKILSRSSSANVEELP